MEYSLYFGDIKIGVVKEDDADFPSMWGTIVFDDQIFKSSDKEIKRISTFIKLNVESTRLIDIEDQQDVSKELDEINAQLNEYMDYIETEDWYLINEEGKKQFILVPIFRCENEIVWRWNFKQA